MTITTIYYSYTGVTRGVAQKVQAACGGEIIEVKSVKPYSKLTAYTTGCYRAARGEADEIEPATIDVAASDVIVIGTPVWMLRAAPAINGAVEALAGCEGKTAVLFATCGGAAKDTLPHLAEALAAKGVTTAAMVVLTTEDVQDAEKIDALIEAVKSAGN
ncbi:ArsR family transcriptional regulator [Methanomicrobiaceae archaeon CYW5]|uniref:flavodoxin family protein n=1 Tax=Methanovulcanius yangii TaxID=1789227 RepID=UPI0029C9E209|nr:flavodoxin [Methanovulcanius yangii]MBT8508267.1 ArsR family transcriptional regulator [Methanovulcanius yangii]